MPDDEDKPVPPPRQPITWEVSATLDGARFGLSAYARWRGPRLVMRQVWLDTGTVGRPSSRDLIRAEAERRLTQTVPPALTLKAFANELVDWLQKTHPDTSPPKPDTIEDHIRDLWNAAKVEKFER